MKRLVALPSFAFAACCLIASSAFLVIAASPSRAATPASCDYTLVTPARVVMNKYEKRFTSQLTVPSGEAACLDMDTHSGYTVDWSVDMELKLYGGGNELYIYSSYAKEETPPPSPPTSGTGRSTEVQYGFVPGVKHWRNPDCNAMDKTNGDADIPCTVTVRPIAIKYASRVKLSASRSGSKVSLHTRALRYTQANGGRWKPENTAISIQRLVRGAWKTVDTATPSNSKTGYTWTVTHTKGAAYRAITPERKAVFGGTSGKVSG